MASPYQATQVINDLPRPRTLVLELFNSMDFSWVDQRLESVKHISSLTDVDLSEWDLVVTDQPLGQPLKDGRRRRLIPRRMYTLEFQTDRGRAVLTIDGVESAPGVITGEKIRWAGGVPGRLLTRVQGLPEQIQDLVISSLAPACEARDMQFGLMVPDDLEALLPTIREVRPFLIGPNGLVLAASYRREGGSRHWILPEDLENPGDWFDAALADWHLTDPRTFPNSGAWQTSNIWMTATEVGIHNLLSQERRDYSAVTEAFNAREAQLSARLESARQSGESGARALLTAKDDELQVAVLTALESIGFVVRDMDLEWPEDLRREDFRLTVPEDDAWLVLADATGSANGAKFSKFSTLQSHAMEFVQAQGGAFDGLWLIVNQLLHRDPEIRGDLFRPDEAEAILRANGLAIDTSALFVLDRAATTDELKLATRSWLRSLRGQLTLAGARTWIESTSPTL